MRGEFIIDIHDLDAAGKVFTSPVRASWLTGALEGCDIAPSEEAPEGQITVRYSRSGNDIVLRGEVHTTLETACARCLAKTTFPVKGEIALMLVPETSPRGAFAKGKGNPPGKKPDEEIELTPSDAELDTYSGDSIVLDGFVREAILLEVPSFPLCSEGCQGIAPPPAGEQAEQPAIDPRLAPLLKLKKPN